MLWSTCKLELGSFVKIMSLVVVEANGEKNVLLYFTCSGLLFCRVSTDLLDVYLLFTTSAVH